MPKIKEKASPAYRATRKNAASRHTRTNVVLDQALVEKAKAKFGVRTAREAIHASMKEATRSYDYSGLIALYGKGMIADDYALDVEPVHKPMTSEQARKYRKKLARLMAIKADKA
ncbi:MAG: hypothetical protein JWR16_3047 [Nevskia sp.]|nr:hypothetical protein [Nevskia sp.]